MFMHRRPRNFNATPQPLWDPDRVESQRFPSEVDEDHHLAVRLGARRREEARSDVDPYVRRTRRSRRRAGTDRRDRRTVVRPLLPARRHPPEPGALSGLHTGLTTLPSVSVVHRLSAPECPPLTQTREHPQRNESQGRQSRTTNATSWRLGIPSSFPAGRSNSPPSRAWKRAGACYQLIRPSSFSPSGVSVAVGACCRSHSRGSPGNASRFGKSRSRQRRIRSSRSAASSQSAGYIEMYWAIRTRCPSGSAGRRGRAAS